MNTENKTSVYEKVTAQIVQSLEKGVTGEFRLPWHHNGSETFFPKNAFSNRPYRGVNVLSLWAKADSSGYDSGLWATFEQWHQLGARVKKGEKGTCVVFWKFEDGKKTDEGEGREEETRKGRVLCRSYHVFNARQVEGFSQPETTRGDLPERIEEAEVFFRAVGAEIRHGGSRAYYSPKTDHVQLPELERFRDSESYYAVLGHEVTHWTGAEKRLNRDLKNRFGSEAYALEELVAELGAAFISAELGISNAPREDHAKYLSSWLKVLKDDSRAIFVAASKAKEAVDLMWSKLEEKRKAA